MPAGGGDTVPGCDQWLHQQPGVQQVACAEVQRGQKASGENNTSDQLSAGGSRALWSLFLPCCVRSSGVQSDHTDNSRGETRRTVFIGAQEVMQACDKAGPTVEASRVMSRCTQGGLCQITDQPTEGAEACCKAVVLYPH